VNTAGAAAVPVVAVMVLGAAVVPAVSAGPVASPWAFVATVAVGAGAGEGGAPTVTAKVTTAPGTGFTGSISHPHRQGGG